MALENKVIYYHPWNFGRLVLNTEEKINILFNQPKLELAFYTVLQLANGKVLSCGNIIILKVSIYIYMIPLRNSQGSIMTYF